MNRGGLVNTNIFGDFKWMCLSKGFSQLGPHDGVSFSLGLWISVR